MGTEHVLRPHNEPPENHNNTAKKNAGSQTKTAKAVVFQAHGEPRQGIQEPGAAAGE